MRIKNWGLTPLSFFSPVCWTVKIFSIVFRSNFLVSSLLPRRLPLLWRNQKLNYSTSHFTFSGEKRHNLLSLFSYKLSSLMAVLLFVGTFSSFSREHMCWIRWIPSNKLLLLKLIFRAFFLSLPWASWRDAPQRSPAPREERGRVRKSVHDPFPGSGELEMLVKGKTGGFPFWFRFRPKFLTTSIMSLLCLRRNFPPFTLQLDSRILISLFFSTRRIGFLHLRECSPSWSIPPHVSFHFRTHHRLEIDLNPELRNSLQCRTHHEILQWARFRFHEEHRKSGSKVHYYLFSSPCLIAKVVDVLRHFVFSPCIRPSQLSPPLPCSLLTLSLGFVLDPKLPATTKMVRYSYLMHARAQANFRNKEAFTSVDRREVEKPASTRVRLRSAQAGMFLGALRYWKSQPFLYTIS